MSRESRLAKRDSKLKKLAAKRGVERLPPQKKSMGDLIHTARAVQAHRQALTQAAMENHMRMQEETSPTGRFASDVQLQELPKASGPTK